MFRVCEEVLLAYPDAASIFMPPSGYEESYMQFAKFTNYPNEDDIFDYLCINSLPATFRYTIFISRKQVDMTKDFFHD